MCFLTSVSSSLLSSWWHVRLRTLSRSWDSRPSYHAPISPGWVIFNWKNSWYHSTTVSCHNLPHYICVFSIGGRAHVVGGHILPLLKVVDGHAAIIETHHQHVRMVWMDVAGHHLQVNGFWEVSNLTLPHNVSDRGTQGRKGSSRRTCKQSLVWPGKIFSWEWSIIWMWLQPRPACRSHSYQDWPQRDHYTWGEHEDTIYSYCCHTLGSNKEKWSPGS